MLFVFDFCVEGRRLNIDLGQKLKWFWIDESDTGSCRFHCDLKNRFQRHLRPNHLTPYQRRMTHIQRQTNNRTKQQTTLLYSTDEFPWQNGTKRNNDQDKNPYTYIYSAFKITVSNERINNLFRELIARILCKRTENRTKMLKMRKKMAWRGENPIRKQKSIRL